MKKQDRILDTMTEYFDRKEASVKVERHGNGYSIIHESGTPVARIQKEKGGKSELVEVLWWSHRDKWDHIGDFGGMIMGLEEALEYVVSDPLGIFWIGQIRGRANASMQTKGRLGMRALIGKIFGTDR